MTEIDVQINPNVPLDASVFPYQEGDGREIGTYTCVRPAAAVVAAPTTDHQHPAPTPDTELIGTVPRDNYIE